jgi:hypothetical protein
MVTVCSLALLAALAVVGGGCGGGGDFAAEGMTESDMAPVYYLPPMQRAYPPYAPSGGRQPRESMVSGYGLTHVVVAPDR